MGHWSKIRKGLALTEQQNPIENISEYETTARGSEEESIRSAARYKLRFDSVNDRSPPQEMTEIDPVKTHRSAQEPLKQFYKLNAKGGIRQGSIANVGRALEVRTKIMTWKDV